MYSGSELVEENEQRAVECKVRYLLKARSENWSSEKRNK